MFRANNTNSNNSVMRKMHMDMVRRQQLLVDSLLGTRAEDTQSLKKNPYKFSPIIVPFLSLQGVANSVVFNTTFFSNK